MPGFTGHIRIRSILALGVALPATIAAFAGLTANAQNILPQGGFVVGGTVTGAQTATALTINQSSARAIINWNSFSVGAANSVTFNQPNSSAAILNRVTGATPSNIAGQINANGQVFLVNPNGIAIGPTGTVNVGGGFVASTLDISNSNFMAGNLQFFGNGSSARVSNQGTINVGSGGFVGLFGGTVSNTGTISVPLGKVGIGSGEQVTLDLNGDGFMQVALSTNAAAPNGQSLIEVAGAVQAAGGKIQITAASVAQAIRNVVNVSGSLSATALAGVDGAIVLGGGSGGNVKVTGNIDASGTTSAGSIVATGANVTLTGAMLSAQSQTGRGGTIVLTAADTVTLAGATLNASGATGGGAIRIGGDFNGGGNIATAASTLVDATSVLKSDALTSGNGGTVGLWSQNLTSFAGQISATGSVGGSVQVSSAGNVNVTGSIDVSGTTNAGSIMATGANVTLTGATLNASGETLPAAAGIITVTAADTVTLTGATLNASGAQGGVITVTAANTVTLTGATLNAPGAAVGGAIRVGGDFNGLGTIATASTTVVDAASLLSSNGDAANGTGGTVVVWSNNFTSFAGQIFATGFVGGTVQVQVSPAGVMDYRGGANVTGANRTFGTLMIDPPNIIISTDPTSGIATMTAGPGFVAVQGGTVYLPTTKNAVLNITTLNNALQGKDVFVIAAYPGNSPSRLGNIIINAPIDSSIVTSCGANCASVQIFGTLLSLQASNLTINPPPPASTYTIDNPFGFRVAAVSVQGENFISPSTSPYVFNVGNGFAQFGTSGGGEVTVVSSGVFVGADIIAPTPISPISMSVTVGGNSPGAGGGGAPGGSDLSGGTPLFGNPASGPSTTTISYNTQPSTITNYSSGKSNQSSGNSGSCSGSAISQSLNQKGSAVVFGGQGSSCN